MAFPTSLPSAQGVSPDALAAFVESLERAPGVEPHGLVVHRHGHRIADVAWAPHSTTRPRLVYSLSKTFTGTALGLAVAEGLVSLDDLVSDHLPDLFDDGVPDRTRRMRVRHIASMASGHDHETLPEARDADPDDVVRGFLHLPPDQEPGTVFAYNQPPVLALATILQRRAGCRLSAYLRPRLLDPLGITGFSWAEHAPGVDLGYSGVHTSVDAVARLGQLHLDDGVWEGRRLLPEGWVAEASRAHIDNPLGETVDWRQGYGFQLWRCQHGYRGDGACGQYMVVLPEQDAVVALFSSTVDMQVVLDLLWELLLPAMGAPGEPEAGEAERVAALSARTVPTVAERKGGRAPEPIRATLTPTAQGRFRQRTLTAATVDGLTLVLHEDGGSLKVPLQCGWTESATVPVATDAAVLDDGRTQVDLAFLDTPHRLKLVLDPAAGTFSSSWPVPPMVGTRSSLLDLRAPTP